MNTTDVEVKGLIKSFDDLYKYAKEQFLMYEKLEGIEDWEAYDFCIDCPEDQAKFKDMLQIRFIEELTEATTAKDHLDHFKEELADAVNFFLSAYIMLGVNFKDFTNPEYLLCYTEPLYFGYSEDTLLFSQTYVIVEAVGYLCNLLKNRPWAQSNYLVSLLDLDIRLKLLWDKFWLYLGEIGLTAEAVFEMFERKFEVNKFRISSGY